ncbi:MAG: hypothetical protein H5U08_05820 [Thermogutta sp.]|uniref:hypothetical protein n=1 Tax=Thermogutta sp. TaxID=1962930 RepID=UPI00199B2D00|nr:hypothetical protein [Thermogutta sp.]MBC7351857.1 hypothetical protein [Thermogutta sp.]
MARVLLAYIDPGSGAILLQVLIAAVIGAIAFVGRIRDFVSSAVTRVFKRSRARGETPSEVAEADTPVPERKAA